MLTRTSMLRGVLILASLALQLQVPLMSS
jgi:hypothetical protein